MTSNSSKRPQDPLPTGGANSAAETTWSRLEQMLDVVLAESGERRRAKAQELSQTDPSLRAELMEFLDSVEASEGYLEPGAAESWPALLADLDQAHGASLSAGTPAVAAVSGKAGAASREGQELGVYRLERLLGRGGMGDVYLARRVDGAFEREVAIKIVRAQRGGMTALERFRAEQQILAELDHRHIAGLLDAGLTDDGVPFAVMEYVEGRPIDLFCVELPIEQRLRLFLEVCEAVDHAHRRLVIHRDLKPSNILVDGSGEVKLLDFGIAKLLDPQSGASQDAGTLYLTPEYAAPEQFLRGRLSIATDVYALGAILFELLTGRSLRRFEESSPPVWMKRIVDEKAPRPSRSAQEPRIARRLEGDLDAIVQRALESDPEERYPSARALADDIERHLASLPIEVRSASRLYRAGKMLKRHWLSLSLSALAAAALLFSTFIAVRQSSRAEREREKAVASAAQAERVSGFLVDLFDGWDPLRFEKGEISARDLLDLGAERVRRRKDLEDQPRFELILTLSDVYSRIGLYEESRELLRELTQRDPPLSDVEMARLLHYQGHLESDSGDFEAAERIFREGLRRLDASGLRSVDATKLRCSLLNSVATSVGQLGRAEEATEHLLASLELSRQIGSKPHQAASLASLGSYVHGGHRYAPEYLRQAIELYKLPDVQRPKNLSSTLNNLALHLLETGEWAEAAKIFEELNAARIEQLGRYHSFRAANIINLASLRINQGYFDQALELLDEADKIHDFNQTASNAPERIAVRMSRGRSLAELGQIEGLEILEETRRFFLEERGDDHPWMTMIDHRVGEAALRFGRSERALELAEGALARATAQNPRRVDAELVHGAALAQLGRCSEALPTLEKVSEALAAKLPEHAWRLAWARLELHECRIALGEEGGLAENIVLRLESARGAEDPMSRRARSLASP